jgi:hypothetical protein
MSMSRKFKIGQIVRARCVITDKDSHGQHYIHAVRGTIGIIINTPGLGSEGWPTVSWEPQGFGVCDVPPRKLNSYDAEVFQVVD